MNGKNFNKIQKYLNINNYLTELELNKLFNEFYNNNCHSLELLFIQMLSKLKNTEIELKLKIN